MRLKIGIVAIVLCTMGLTALIYVIINQADLSSQDLKAQQKDPKDLPRKEHGDFSIKQRPKVSLKPPKALKPSSQDETIIKELAKLSDAELALEHNQMSERIKKENLLLALEERRMSAEEAHKAKALIERFTLLSLESTRRKYLPVEPELKDALFAHRDSLKDIREVLSHY